MTHIMPRSWLCKRSIVNPLMCSPLSQKTYIKLCCDFFSLSFSLFRTTPVAYGSSQARGQIRDIAASVHHSHSNVGSEPCLWPAHGNAGSLTHRARPGMELMFSGILVEFITAEPQWELCVLWLLMGKTVLRVFWEAVSRFDSHFGANKIFCFS